MRLRAAARARTCARSARGLKNARAAARRRGGAGLALLVVRDAEGHEQAGGVRPVHVVEVSRVERFRRKRRRKRQITGRVAVAVFIAVLKCLRRTNVLGQQGPIAVKVVEIHLPIW